MIPTFVNYSQLGDFCIWPPIIQTTLSKPKLFHQKLDRIPKSFVLPKQG